MDWSRLCWNLKEGIFHRWPFSLSLQFSPLWYSFLRTLVSLVSLEFQLHLLKSGVFWALPWFLLLMLPPGESKVRKLLCCSTHLSHFPFLKDHCFCCLIFSDIKMALLYIFVCLSLVFVFPYNMVDLVPVILSWSGIKDWVLLCINSLKIFVCVLRLYIRGAEKGIQSYKVICAADSFF